MDIKVPRGKYVLAVSGGVDSMVLLDLLSNLSGIEIIIAHFNHGIRPEAGNDEELVTKAARSYDLPIEVGRAELGQGASEEASRLARYDFLRAVQTRHRASKIITAHHQDDLIETALINLVRGTGRQGLSAISSNANVLRPLLGIPKSRLLQYAQTHKLKWHEDITNESADYLRNRLRRIIFANMTTAQRRELLDQLTRISSLNLAIDKNIAILSQLIGNRIIDRTLFSALPMKVGNEILVYRLRQTGVRDFDSRTINRLNLAIRIARADSTYPVRGGATLKVGQQTAELLTS
jgi:tRNA(Ile)-lysidine synthetase-like protein